MRRTAKQVIAEVAREHGIDSVNLTLSTTRKRDISWPRQQAMFEVYLQCPHLSYPAIGRAFGGMDHTTVIHGVKEHCKRTGFDYETIRRTRPKVLGSDRIVTFRGPPPTAQAYREAARVA